MTFFDEFVKSYKSKETLDKIGDIARTWTNFKTYKTNLLVETALSGGKIYTRSQDRLPSGQFGAVNIQPAIEKRRSRYSDTTIILSLQANVHEISVRAWNTMLNTMKDHNQLHYSAEIPSFSTLNRYSLMLPTFNKFQIDEFITKSEYFDIYVGISLI